MNLLKGNSRLYYCEAKGGNKFISIKELSIWMQEKEIVNTVS